MTWTSVAIVELVLGALAVALDVLLPTLVLLALMALSLLARRDRLASLGVTRLMAPWRNALRILGWTVAWTVLQIGLVLPLLEHASGRRQDLSDFSGLEGDIGTLLVLLTLSWTLAAIGEELAYRGYLFTRVTDVLGSATVGVLTATVLTSVLFGLAHGFNNTIGLTAFFLVGPVYGLW